MEIGHKESDQIMLSIDRVARLTKADRIAEGFASITLHKRPEDMTDSELMHGILGVQP